MEKYWVKCIDNEDNYVKNILQNVFSSLGDGFFDKLTDICNDYYIIT